MSSTPLPTPTDPSSPLFYPAPKTALILLDFQNFIVARVGPEAHAAIANAKKLQDWARAKGVLTIHSIVNLALPPLKTCKGAANFDVYRAQIGEEGAAITSALGAEHEHVFKKRIGVVSGLKAEGIMELLREKGIESLIMCGFSTSGAVLRTAVPATDGGFVVTVVGDACRDAEGKERVHEMLLGEVLGSRGWVVGADEVMEGFCR